MKPHLYIAAILFCVSLHAQAQNHEKKARIKYLFSLMKQDSLVLKQVDASINAYKSLSNSIVDSTRVKLDSSMIQRRDVFMQKIINVTKVNALKLLNEDMVDVYDQYFTDEEIEAFCVFYQTPAGKKMIDNTPAIAKDVMTRSMTKYQPELMKLIKEFMDESKREIDLKFKK
jgi:hypothetical protein